MYPWEVTCIKWNKGAVTGRPLSKEQIGQLVQQAQFRRAKGHDNQNRTLIYGAKLDGKTIVASAAAEPKNDKELSLLEWVELIPTGREVLTEEEHRKHVENALDQGQPVPSKVLAAYPEIVRPQTAISVETEI